jgi:hypothetical protein
MPLRQLKGYPSFRKASSLARHAGRRTATAPAPIPSVGVGSVRPCCAATRSNGHGSALCTGSSSACVATRHPGQHGAHRYAAISLSRLVDSSPGRIRVRQRRAISLAVELVSPPDRQLPASPRASYGSAMPRTAAGHDRPCARDLGLHNKRTRRHHTCHLGLSARVDGMDAYWYGAFH